MLKSFVKVIFWRLIRWIDGPQKLRQFGEPIFWLTGFRRSVNRRRPPANLAVIKLDRLGDVVLCSQLLAGLRRGWPNTRITLFVRQSLVDLARLCRDVDEVVGVPVDEGNMVFDPRSEEYYGWGQQLAKWLEFCHQGKFWKRRFGATLVPRWDTDYYGALPLAYLLGAPLRWGATEAAMADKVVANRDFDRLLTHVVKGRSVRHEVLLNKSFLQMLNIEPIAGEKLVSWVKESDQKKAADIMVASGVDFSRKAIVVCMGAGWPSKMWPVASYASLCKAAFDFETVQFLTFGTAAESNLGLQLGNMLGGVVINLEGKLPLGLLPAAVSLGSLYIGSDTGTKHLAAAAGLPVFEINCHPRAGKPYWAESPRRFGPWSVLSRVVQPEKATAPCETHCIAGESHCILGVSDKLAVDALRSFLEQPDLKRLVRSELNSTTVT